MVDSFVSSVADAMGAGNNLPDIETTIYRSVSSLCQIVKDFLNKDIELIRIGRIAVLLKESGVNPETILYHNLTEKCIDMQRDDGGWTDVVETMWCIMVLNHFNEFSDPVEKALLWLKGQEHKDGGWGKSERDSTRIPITGLLLYLLPQLSSDKNLKWLENEWCQDRELKPCLTYKAAFTLMAFSQNNYHPESHDLITETVHWLFDQQNDDGGWGPWKGHPAGSDPWCTGIGMVGLSQYPDKFPQEVLSKALKWLREKQLPNGLWPYHYIEEGSGWALYALVMGYKLLNAKDVD